VRYTTCVALKADKRSFICTQCGETSKGSLVWPTL